MGQVVVAAGNPGGVAEVIVGGVLPGFMLALPFLLVLALIVMTVKGLQSEVLGAADLKRLRPAPLRQTTADFGVYFPQRSTRPTA